MFANLKNKLIEEVKSSKLQQFANAAQAVLVETQEKAIRRINELREQCTLEQQAKAHLEEALRIEMDDMNCKMQAYQTKLKLLGENPDNIIAALNDTERKQANSEQLIDLETTQETTNGDFTHNVAVEEEMSGRIALLEKQLAEREKELLQLQQKFDESIDHINKLKLQEEENSLLLAQTKQAIHSELENKEKEVKKLNTNIEQLQNELTAAQKKGTQVNTLTEELTELKKKFKSIEVAKQESDAKVIATEHLYNEMKDQLAMKEKALSESEIKLTELQKANQSEVDELRRKNQGLNETIQQHEARISALADVESELSKTKHEINTLNETIHENHAKLQNYEKELNKTRELSEQAQKDLLNKDAELSAERAKLGELQQQINDNKQQFESERERVQALEQEVRVLKEQTANNESETIIKLKAELQKNSEETKESLKALKEQIICKEKDLKNTTNKLNKLTKAHESLKEEKDARSREEEGLKNELLEEKTNLELQLAEARSREEQKEYEKNQLQNQISGILQEIAQMEEQMSNVRKSHNDLEAEKQQLEKKIEQMQENSQAGTQKLMTDLTRTQEQLKQVEHKLQNVESENTQLLEKNCLLEESMQSLEKQIVEYERMKDGDEANASEMRLKLATAEDAIQKLNEKMSQLLDENSRMQNAQELMEHDQRTRQDRCDALEKEKLLALDAQKCAENEKEQLLVQHGNEISKLTELIKQLQNNERMMNEDKCKLEEKISKLENEREELSNNCAQLTQCLEEMKVIQTTDSELKELLQAKQSELMALQNSQAEAMEESTNEIKKLTEKLDKLESESQAYERAKEELALLRSQQESLLSELQSARDDLIVKTQRVDEMETELVELRTLKETLEHTTKELNLLRSERVELQERLKHNETELLKKCREVDELHQQNQQNKSDEEKLAQLSSELVILREIEGKLKTEFAAAKSNYEQQLQQLQNKYSKSQNDVERLNGESSSLLQQLKNVESKQVAEVSSLKTAIAQLEKEKAQLVEETAEHARKLDAFDELKIENEYLNKLVKQLETDLEKQKHDTVSNSLDSEELKVKFKSLQCELYVHKENAETYKRAVQVKEQEIETKQAELEQVTADLKAERVELQRQAEHVKYITEQNDQIQKELLHTQQQLAELEHKHSEVEVALNELRISSTTNIKRYEEKITALEKVLNEKQQTIENLEKQLEQYTIDLNNKKALEAELQALKVQLAEHENSVKTVAPSTVETGKNHIDGEHLRQLNDTLQRELEELTRKTRLEIESLEHENDELKCNNQQMFERISNLETTCAELKDANGNDSAPASSDNETQFNADKISTDEKAELEAKLRNIMSEVQEVSNRNLFLEQKCENFLILEQSNERLKLQNAKLSRQLDETLVSMQHNEGVSANTEFEYLRNIMFQYLTGSANGNNETLVKVISAVLKFSPQQTQVALEKEHQRRSLINKIL